MNTKISQSIDFIKVPLTIFVVLLHSYTAISINDSLYYTLAYPILIVGEIGVPAFLFISGYLFFTKMSPYWDWKQYKQKMDNRLSSLLRPYLIWNSIMILFYFALGSIPFFSNYLSGANKPVSEYGISDFLLAYWDKGETVNGTPILQPYWYVRNLIILCLFSPIIYFLTKRLGILFLIATGLWWMLTNHNAFTQASIFFFSFGAFCQIKHIDFIQLGEAINSKTIYTIAIILFATDYLTHTHFHVNGALQIHRINLIFSIFALFTLAASLAYKHKIPDIFNHSAFFVYTIHFPIILAIRKVLYKLCSNPNGIVQFLILILAFVMTYALCLIIYKAWKTMSPQSLNFMMGGRT